jgi:riboflavin kinase/FMN adenylyltransferase
MIIVQQLDNVQTYPRPALTLGNFDGVHRGHRAILQRVVERADQLRGTSVVFTFCSHPLELLAPDKRPPLLTTLEEKAELLRRMGIQVLICVPFTTRLAKQSAEVFLGETIHRTIHPAEIIVGHDYAFGHRRQGTVQLLERMQSPYGYRVEVVEAVRVGGSICSSTLIRQRITQGRLEEANQLLGRVYSISAPVVAGSQKGKGLGYPTATLGRQPKLVPAEGVYAVWVQLNEQIFKGVTNIGHQPTYGRHPRRVEVHILDFEGNIYGKQLRVSFAARLRDEVAFADERALKTQIEKDLIRARQILRQPPALL